MDLWARSKMVLRGIRIAEVGVRFPSGPQWAQPQASGHLSEGSHILEEKNNESNVS